MRRWIVATIVALGAGLVISPAVPEPACADLYCGRNVRCVTSSACGSGCACIGGFCTSFREAP